MLYIQPKTKEDREKLERALEENGYILPAISEGINEPYIYAITFNSSLVRIGDKERFGDDIHIVSLTKILQRLN